MNKKILTIFLAILLICTLCVTIVACGDKDNNDDSNPNGEQTDTPSTDTPAPDDGGSSPIAPSPDDGGSSPIEPDEPGNEEISSNLLFELKTNDTYEVIGYTGEPISVVIPATYNGKAVTSIGERAFFGCHKLVEIYNLSSLTIEKGSYSNGHVGYYALDVYTSLDTPSKLSTDSNGYIIHTNGEEKILVGCVGSESELTLPSGITSINQGAFLDKNTITSVVIPNSVTSIGSYAFSGCHKLVEIYNLSSLTIEKGSYLNGYVGYYALDVYTSLDTPSKLSTDSKGYIIHTNGEEKTLVGYTGSETDLTLPSDITTINQGAFYGCTSIKSVTIPDSVTSIGSYAFELCTSLTSVTIGNSVTSIGEDAFRDCDSLSSVNYLGTIEQWCGITFDYKYANPLSYGAKLYLNGELVEDLVIPNTVTEIKNCAFEGCTSIKSVTIPNSVTSIGSSAFSSCDSPSRVYYNGTEEEWSGISIGDDNGNLTDATRYYYSETEPTTSGNYWHYVEGVPTPW